MTQAYDEIGLLVNKIGENKEYIKGLHGLESFSHIDVLWWFDKCDNSSSRSILEVNKPYKKTPEKLVFFN